MADTKDFEKLATPHLDLLFRVAMTYCHNVAEAEDLVQTTVLKGLKRFGSFRPGTNIKAWLLRILRNAWIDEMRHRKVVGPNIPVEEQMLADENIEDPADWADPHVLLEQFSDQQIIQAMKELPDEQRLTLYLVDVEQLNQDKVAEITSVAVGTVKSRTSRARATLKRRLEKLARNRGFTGRRS